VTRPLRGSDSSPGLQLARIPQIPDSPVSRFHGFRCRFHRFHPCEDSADSDPSHKTLATLCRFPETLRDPSRDSPDRIFAMVKLSVYRSLMDRENPCNFLKTIRGSLPVFHNAIILYIQKIPRTIFPCFGSYRHSEKSSPLWAMRNCRTFVLFRPLVTRTNMLNSVRLNSTVKSA